MENTQNSPEVGVALPRLVLLRCCVCGTTTETYAVSDDPPETAEIRGTACLNCDHGGWDSPTYHRPFPRWRMIRARSSPAAADPATQYQPSLIEGLDGFSETWPKAGMETTFDCWPTALN